MNFLYNAVFLLFCLGYLPVFLLKKKATDHLGERFGRVPKREGTQPCFWLHAVSLGEALAARSLIDEIRKRHPGLQFAFSTTTRTGRTVLEKMRQGEDLLFYFPLNFTGILRRAVRRLRPDFFATMETEIWPALILVLKEGDIPVFLLNGRISTRSFNRYRRIRWALRRPLQGIDLFCMQYPEDAERVQRLGAPSGKVFTVGNMKFDVAYSGGESASGIRGRLGLKSHERLWVAGSTHPGEERFLLEAYGDLTQRHPDLRLLIAPRHPERAKEVARLIDGFRQKAVLISENGGRSRERSVLVLDTVGQLRSMYAAADFVFIGGSLVRRGGQNLLEPAFFGKPILFGPHMENFRDIVKLFLDGEAALKVHDRTSLKEAADSLLRDRALSRRLGEKARMLILSQQGVVQRHLLHLEPFLSSR